MQALIGRGWHDLPLSEAAQASFYLIPGDKRLLRVRTCDFIESIFKVILLSCQTSLLVGMSTLALLHARFLSF